MKYKVLQQGKTQDSWVTTYLEADSFDERNGNVTFYNQYPSQPVAYFNYPISIETVTEPKEG